MSSTQPPDATDPADRARFVPGRAPVPTRRAKVPQERGEGTRRRILEETVACVLDEGFGAASASRVTARAGVTWGVIQYHFGGRDGLLRAVVDHGFAGLTAALDEVTDGDGPRDVGVFVAAAWRAFSSRESMAALEILVATRGRRDDATEEYVVALERRMRALGELIAPGADSRRVVHLMWLCLRGMALERLVAPESAEGAVSWELSVVTDALRALQAAGDDAGGSGTHP